MSFPSPLPLTAFEEYMLRDDRPKYPMSIIARLRFSGQLDRRATTEALETVVERHPLLRAKVCKTPNGGLEWIASADRPVSVAWIDGPADDRLPSMRPIDLFAEPGLRSWAIGGFATECARASTAPCCLRRQGNDSIPGRLCAKLCPYLGRKAVPDRAFAQRSSCVARRGSFGLTVRRYLRMLPVQLRVFPVYESSSCSGRFHY